VINKTIAIIVKKVLEKPKNVLAPVVRLEITASVSLKPCVPSANPKFPERLP